MAGEGEGRKRKGRMDGRGKGGEIRGKGTTI